MELQFNKSSVAALEPGIQEVRNMEQTQELRLSEGMPDIGAVLGAWGQAVVRGKEWRPDGIGASAGMMIWILYAAEDGSGYRCLESWIPFQFRWELPEGLPEGRIRIKCLTRFVDARSVSARKMMIRAGMACYAQTLSPREESVYLPGDMPEEVQLLRSRYPVRIPREAGEKAFPIDEELTLPESAPQPERIVSCTLQPEITEQKVIGNKVVFRGNANARLLYLSEEGQIHGWDFPLPFSQLGELEADTSGETQADTMLCVTNLEPVLDDEGHMRIKCALVGQYLIGDMEMIEVAEDAYSPGRELKMEREWLELPAVLENRREILRTEQTVNTEANLAADIRVLPDFPRQRRTEDGVELAFPGSFQILYYGADGTLQSANARWEGDLSLGADGESRIEAIPQAVGEPHLTLGNGTMTVRADIPVQVTTTGKTRIPMVTGLSLGERVQPEPGRPSLILRRSGGKSMWELAKSCGSTVAAITRANGLEGEPAEDQMLLIPVS